MMTFIKNYTRKLFIILFLFIKYLINKSIINNFKIAIKITSYILKIPFLKQFKKTWEEKTNALDLENIIF